MAKHLREAHKITVESAVDLEILQIAAEHEVLPDMAVDIPAPKGPPVEGLAVIQAWSCPACAYCSKSKASLLRHQSHTHAEDGGQAVGFSQVKGQNFFDAFHNVFGVEPAFSKDPKGSVFNAILAEMNAEAVATAYIAPPAHIREVMPLLNITGWHEHLADYVVNKRKVKELRALSDLPKSKDTTPLLLIRVVIFEYMQQIRVMSKASPLGVRCILMEYPR